MRRLLGWLLFPVIWLLKLFFRKVLRAWWESRAPARRAWQRRQASRWAVRQARLRVFLRRPQAPKAAVVAPHVAVAGATPNGRFFPAVVTANVILLAFALLASQFLPQNEAQAQQSVSVLPTRTFTPTVTSTPTITPTPTQTPTPTPITIALTPWPTPDPLISGGSVAFTLRKNGNSDLYALSIGQDEPIRLTNHPDVDRDPVWSPDGRRLAFTTHRDGNWEIYVLELVTGELIRVTEGLAFDGGPSWSPDGQWLVYESYQEENLDIYIIKVDGSKGPIRLTEHPAPDFAPQWSPDGRHIAFTSWRSGNKDIFIMSLDAVGDENALNLTNTLDQQEDSAAFAPNGRYLAYHDDSGGFDLVYVQELENYAPAGDPIPLGQGSEPTWSPNGDSLAYVHTVNSQTFLIASSVDAWAIAPQAYATFGLVNSPTWSAITFAEEPEGWLTEVADTVDVPLFTEEFALAEGGETYLLKEVGVGIDLPYLSDRVDQSFLALGLELQGLCGWNILGDLDRLYEPIDSRPAPGQSDRTWHKAGRAFDLNYENVMSFSPTLEIVREDVENTTYWRVFARTTLQDGTLGEPLRDLPWNFRLRYGADPGYYDDGGAWKDAIPSGYYVDVTAVALDYGWERAAANENWRTYFPSIRFWQFENRQGLSWEEAMLEVYTEQELQANFRRR